jgi:hypothetical protein
MKHFNTSLKAFTIKTSKTINAITTALHQKSKKQQHQLQHHQNKNTNAINLGKMFKPQRAATETT